MSPKSYGTANQLVSNITPDGKEIYYTYDAAGRLVKEGEKTYEYGWLDKVMRVAEDGKELARFEYHNNGQIAKAIRKNGVKTFEWDGLALIERSGTKYINEPHPGGGNPVLAINGDSYETIFTDMLGTSLGKIEENGYYAITKTSFGAESNNANSFFTGKPYVENLGYAFLFRNYRADMGKWLSQDLIGYPDGWNNFTYCRNIVSSSIDFSGTWTMPGVIASITGDDQGRQILDHWLEGSGTSMNIYKDSSWSTYMRSNSTLTSQIDAELEKDAINRETSGTLNPKNINVIIENGYTTGYEYLHGTNGGLDIIGTVTATKRPYSDYLYEIQLEYNVTLTWNDIIDPNETYERDRFLANGAEWFYNPKNYSIKITWDDQFSFTRYIPIEE